MKIGINNFLGKNVKVTLINNHTREGKLERSNYADEENLKCYKIGKYHFSKSLIKNVEEI